MKRAIQSARRRRGSARRMVVEIESIRRRSAVVVMELAPTAVVKEVRIAQTVFFTCPRPGEGQNCGEAPGSPVEVRPDGDVEVPGRPGGRRYGRLLAQQKSDGVCEPGTAESRSGRPRSRSEEPKRGHHARNVLGPADKREPGRVRRRFDSETQSTRGGHGRSKLAERSTHGIDPSPECRSGHNRGEGSSIQSRVENVETPVGDHQDKEQIGTRRRRVAQERTFRDAIIEGEEKSQQRLRNEGEVRQGGESNPTSSAARSQEGRRRSPAERIKSAMETEQKAETKRPVVEEGQAPRQPPSKKPRGDEKRKGPQSHSSQSWESGRDSEVDEKEVEETLVEFRKWLKENPMDGLTTVQCGAHLFLQVVWSGTSFGKYLRRMLEPHEGERQDRQRSILPLPLKEDSLRELKKILASGEYKRLAGTWKDKRAAGASKTKKEMRKVGLLVWHGLIIAGLNFLWNGGRSNGRVCTSKPSKAQLLCQDRLWEASKVFVDDASETPDKLVKAPDSEDWNNKVDKMRISYHGEVVEKAQALTLEQILPGLPPPGFGGKVPLVELCEGEVKRLLQHPEEALLEGLDLPVKMPKPKVMASDEEWEKIGGELFRRGLVRPVEQCAKLDGRKILNGAFGVVKPNKTTPGGEEVLRLIMDFRACNAVTRIIEGDVRTLASAPALQHVVMPSGSVLRLSAEDLVAAFYLFSLPEEWSQLMCFEKKVSWKALGEDRPGSTWIGACVLPMGWNSAVGVMQHAHRRLALRSPFQGGAGLLPEMEVRKDAVFPVLDVEGSAIWSLYLDDTNILELIDKKVAKSLEGRPSDEQARLRAAYTHWGIPFSAEKAAVRAKECEKLGAVIDGERGLLRASTKRGIESIALGAWMMEKEYPPRKVAQVFAGKEVHTLQFRRPLFSVFSQIWKAIGAEGYLTHIDRGVIEEVLLVGCLQPMKFTNLKAELNDVVTASDACETGGGTVFANRLSLKGLTEIVALEEGLEEVSEIPSHIDQKETIVVFDWLSRSLELAKIKVASLIVIELDSDCRRLHRRRWPGCECISDIRSLTKEEMVRLVKRIPGVTGIIAGGGSPCQGLSRLSSRRERLADPRLALFFDLSDRLTWVQEIGVQLDIWTLRFCENVIGDPEDVETMSSSLGMVPAEVCASCISRVRRPRLYWSSAGLDDHPSYQREAGVACDKVIFEGPLEPLSLVLDEGWGWPSAELDDGAKLPTFTRAIPRQRPPPDPAGIKQCDETTLRRWRDDRMKFPPYTYLPQFLMRKKGDGSVRVATANEREVLMGFQRGYTKALFKKKATNAVEEEQQEVQRMAALGNSFHCLVVACLLDLWLWSRKIRTEPLGSAEIIRGWHEEMRLSSPPSTTGDDAEEGQGIRDEETEAEELAMLPARKMGKPHWVRPSSSFVSPEKEKHLRSQLVLHFLRRMEFRGSDVRLDLGLFYRPEAAPRTSIDPSRWSWSVAHSYPYTRKDHINVLELRSILHALEWRSRVTSFKSCRFLHLSDSQVCLSVLTKGRSSSRPINRLLRRVAALCLALDLLPLWAWVESRLNPADEPSRRYEPSDQAADN